MKDQVPVEAAGFRGDAANPALALSDSTDPASIHYIIGRDKARELNAGGSSSCQAAVCRQAPS